MPNYFISTDLDGTLVDHHSYSYSDALPALELCRELGIPVIFNTSKTRSEARALQRELGIDAPLIVENGSAIIVSGHNDTEDQEILFGVPRTRVLNFIVQVRAAQGWQFSGFNDWSVAEIVERTGLSLDDAANANSKEFSEPFIWSDSDQAFRRFSNMAHEQGLRILKGGRFYHLLGDTDKAKPMLWLKRNYRNVFPAFDEAPEVVALGDNQNDVAMLNAADIAVCVRSPVADFPPLSTAAKIIQTSGVGPVGWNQAVLRILQSDKAPPQGLEKLNQKQAGQQRSAPEQEHS